MSSKHDAAILEEEGEAAADYLEDFLDITDFDGDIDIDVKHGRASVEVLSEDESITKLIGEEGEVLEALQDLTRLAVQVRTGERSRLMLDIGGYRAKRNAVLVDLTNEAIKRVTVDNPIELEPMNSYERKIIHDLAAESGIHSESIGDDPYRYVVLSAANAE